MRTVTINKIRLTQVVKKNRDNHRSEFEKAIEQYREALTTYLNEQIDEVKQGKVIEHFIKLPQPEDHTSSYDQVLEMLDMSVDDTIELTFIEFSQYVRDDWGWKQNFSDSSTALTAYNRSKKL
jgi:hypothetical protein